jgi:hypothetical protein
MLAFIAWFFYLNPLSIEDYNAEYLDNVLTVGYMEEARGKGVPIREHFKSITTFRMLETQNRERAFAYFGHTFHLDYFSHYAPLLNIAYLPFVKLFGVSKTAVGAFAAFYGLLAMGLTGYLGAKLYGRQTGYLSVLLLLTSLSWLIHVRSASQQPALSACLLLAMLALLHSHHQKTPGCPWLHLSGAGICLGLLILTGWIVVPAAVLFVATSLLLLERTVSWRGRLLNVGMTMVAAGITCLVVVLVYAWIYQTEAIEVFRTIFLSMTGRFSQGTNPGESMGIPGKILHFLKCTFWDMTTRDHRDKVLEGAPSVSLVFTILMLVGMAVAMRRRRSADQFLLLAGGCVLLVVTLLVVFANRYAMLLLPIFAIFGGMAVREAYVNWFKAQTGRLELGIFVGILGLVFGLTFFNLHHDYHVRFLTQKEPDFEVDRMRGHSSLYTWIRNHHERKETLLVLSDPICFALQQLHFFNFPDAYSHIYWCNYIREFKNPEELRKWEEEILKKYRKIVYVFSTYQFPQDYAYWSNPSPFHSLHPGLQPDFVYRYRNQVPLIAAFVIQANHSAPLTTR